LGVAHHPVPRAVLMRRVERRESCVCRSCDHSVLIYCLEK
jgi:hypothetical protein